MAQKMMRSLIGFCALLAATGLSGAQTSAELHPPTPFVENCGQWPEHVRFAARGAGWRAAVVDNGWWLALPGAPDSACAVRMAVRGVAPVQPVGVDAGLSPSHFFSSYTAHSSERGARSFQRLRWGEIAPGVDLILRCAEGRLEYDLHLEPDARLDSVVFEVEGAQLADLAEDGSLTLLTPLGPLQQSPPRAFELDAQGTSCELPSAFVRLDDSHFMLEVRGRRTGAGLLLDPALVWSTYIGGDNAQSPRAIAAAAGGGALIAGTTESFSFPTTAGVFDPSHNGASDVFVSALDGQGKLLWSTFIGGLSVDEAYAVAVGANGDVTVAGTTRSADFPVTLGAFDTSFAGPADGFVARLSNAGAQLAWSTFLGGSKHDELRALCVDASAEATVGGFTLSNNFPVTPGTFGQQLAFGSGSDACLARLSADGSALLWSSFLGGTSVDTIEAIALDPLGVLVGGSTFSIDFPFTLGGHNGGEDGFVALLSPGAASISMSRALGGPGDDSVRGVASDGAGLYFAAGRTNSTALPVTAGVFGALHAGLDDGFLATLDNSASIVACSYLGGTETDEIFALSRSSSGELFAAGSTNSPDFPTSPGAFDQTLNVGSSSVSSDAFIVRTTADFSSLSYASFLGGGDDERALALVAIDADSVLIAGETTSYFFPTTLGAHRTSRGILATLEGFASQLDLLQHPIAYGVGKLNSYGASPVLDYTGFPSVQDQNFSWVVHSAIPYQPAVVFIGAQSWNQAFQGGLLYVHPPLSRVAVMSLDFVGYADAPFALNSAMIGTTIFAQAWSKDPGDILGVGLTSALQVQVHP